MQETPSETERAAGIPGASLPDRHCTSESQMATKTPTKPSPQRHARRSHASEVVSSPRQSNCTQIASKAKSIPTMTYWHLEQMVTLSENLFSKLGEGVHEMLAMQPSHWDVNCDRILSRHVNSLI